MHAMMQNESLSMLKCTRMIKTLSKLDNYYYYYFGSKDPWG